MFKKIISFAIGLILLLPLTCSADWFYDTYQQTIADIGFMPDGLVAHYPMNNNAASTTVTDNSAEGNNGTYKDGGGNINTSTGSVAGKINLALDFDGDEYVEVPNVAVLDFTTQMSISCWINTASAVSSPRIGESRDTGAPNHGWTLFIAAGDGSANFQIDSTASAAAATVATDITDSAWHHVVGTWDGANILVYLNGVAGNPAANAGTMAKDVVTRFGRGTQSVAFLTGQIDDVKIFNRAITQREVDRLFNGGNGREG